MKRIKLISYLVGFAACINTFDAEAKPTVNLNGYEFEGNGKSRITKKGPAIDVKGNNFYRQLVGSKTRVNKSQYEVSFDITVTSGNVGVGILNKKKDKWTSPAKAHTYSQGQHKGKITITKSKRDHARLVFTNENKEKVKNRPGVNFVVNSVKFTHNGGTMFPPVAQPKGGCTHTCYHPSDNGRSEDRRPGPF